MDIGRILPTEAAAILNVSPQFVRVAMQQGKLPIGTAVQMSSIWTYHISEKLLADYSGKNIEKEIERIRRCSKMTRNEKKAVIESMAEKFMNIDDLEGKSMTIMVMSAYAEGKAAGKAEERRRWEQKEAVAAV